MKLFELLNLLRKLLLITLTLSYYRAWSQFSSLSVLLELPKYGIRLLLPIHGRRQRGVGAVDPWNFKHDAINVFFNKYSLCDNISTLTNHLSSLLCC